MRVIPAIDIIGGKCVRLTKGDYKQVKQYADNPVEVAQAFEAAGIRQLHLVDLDGAKARHVVNFETLQNISKATSLDVDFGGGVKTRADLEKVLKAGAKQVTAGSIAANNREEVAQWIAAYGADKIILGADVLNEKVMVSGWQENSNIELFEYLEYYQQLGIQYVVCTDIDKDGALQGPSFQLYEKIQKRFPELKLIASGGVSGKEDLVNLKSQGLYGAIVGKAFYEGRLTLEDLTNI
ncbi:1-(5-phosphoribosyl)-5-[(5-phosphoribosylamino)methylideneamino]imidazole-4-carboxamide isomerase [Marinoscillum furvescens]|uniref:1-(5-phosphoribosyl)-5-[(5-phosphoribosylamino)methylideneamino] imidazole-4-carboxamide isomerase n=1 Tax=Marinoscillum furvescens DSM 4134 TaxID=1122208 RepID=A0A3D9L1J7_MARFU|nr:1-(5-phosphoribosyl)-5-[(5-phosphoribosylamino)methylideneamino]imidazole-4-carboxamide isomerase [Marinoscillum furvescens]RED97469.1 1-(5-phosphoribosyl)-5-[(5-phosphoribosylamino)methylideneamino] imidazole-4-carboxamide isomerase [Marinoscillum furvescens DSM 4134]